MTLSYPQSIQPAIDTAMNGTVPDVIMSDVKNIVAYEIKQLSPTVDIKFTDYFNHTYMPDMVLTWGGRRVEQERPVFLRNTLRAETAIFDVRGLRDRAPMVLGLRPVNTDVGELVRGTVTNSRARSTLVSDVASIDQAGRSSLELGAASAPLLSIVRNNLLRSGRGLLTTEDAAALITATEQLTNSESAPGAYDALTQFEEITDYLFAEEGAYQVLRAGRLIRAIQSPELLAEFAETASGRLSGADLSILLPVLLGHEDANSLSPDLWLAVARLIELEDVEALASMEGANIDPLASNAVNRWQAARVELVLNNEFDSDEAAEEEYKRTNWSIRGGKLNATVGPWRLVFASGDKRRLRGASDSPEAIWSDIAPIVSSMAVESATLRGIVRRLTVDAEQSSNVVVDVNRITSTLDDSYRVQHLIVRLPRDEADVHVEVDFRKMLITAETGTASIDELGTLAIRLLGYRYAVQPGWLR